MNLALATFSKSYSYAKKLSGLENRKLAKFHLQVVVIVIKGLDCTWPKSPPFSQFLIRLPPLCVFHHFPLFNWVWWWSWIFSVKCRATEFFHDLWPPTDFHQVHPIIWRPLIMLLSNWSRTFLIIIAPCIIVIIMKRYHSSEKWCVWFCLHTLCFRKSWSAQKNPQAVNKANFTPCRRIWHCDCALTVIIFYFRKTVDAFLSCLKIGTEIVRDRPILY